MLHVYAYLMGTSGLQTTFYQRHIRKPLQHSPMGDSLFGLRTFLQIPNAVDSAVSVITRQCAFHSSAIFLKSTPNEGIIGAFGRMVEELPSQMRFRFRSLGNKQQSRSVFVYTVYQTDIGIVDIKFEFGMLIF